MKKRFTEEQIIGILKEADSGVNVKELCRKHGFSDGSFYIWRSKYAGMEVSEAKSSRRSNLRIDGSINYWPRYIWTLKHSSLLPGESDKPATEA